MKKNKIFIVDACLKFSQIMFKISVQGTNCFRIQIIKQRITLESLQLKGLTNVKYETNQG